MTDRVNTSPSHNLELAGFELRVFGRELPDAHDYWDGNWLRVRAECTAIGAPVWTEGAFVRIDEMKTLCDSVEALRSWQTTKEKIYCMEPNLAIRFEAGARGDLRFVVEITPDHMVRGITSRL